jgi:hypothetical protein
MSETTRLCDPRPALRQAVRDKVLWGWYRYNASDGTNRWVIVPTPGAGTTTTYDGEGVRRYLDLLAAR